MAQSDVNRISMLASHGLHYRDMMTVRSSTCEYRVMSADFYCWNTTCGPDRAPGKKIQGGRV